MSTIILPTGSITTGTITALIPPSPNDPLTTATPIPEPALSSSPQPPSVTTTSRVRSQDPSQNPGYDFFNQGPSMYLYGFLATLGLIFLVSIIVAWRGYYTRRVLRRRIDEAIARGVHIPGYTDPPSGRNGRRGDGGEVGPRPVIWETWILRNREKQAGGAADGLNHEVGNEDDVAEEKIHPNGDLERGWDFKPASITILRPLTEEEEEEDAKKMASSKDGRGRRSRNRSRGARTNRNAPPTSRFHSIIEPLREYWFVRPPAGATAQQLAGMASGNSTTTNTNVNTSASSNVNANQNLPSNNTSTSNVAKANTAMGAKKGTNEGGRKKTELEERVGMAEKVSMSVLILMPSSASPSYQGTMPTGSSASGSRNGEGLSKRISMGSTSALEQTKKDGEGSAAASRSASRVGETVGDEDELPELALGFAEVELGKREKMKENIKGDSRQSHVQETTPTSQEPHPAQETPSIPSAPSVTTHTPTTGGSSLVTEQLDTR